MKSFWFSNRKVNRNIFATKINSNNSKPLCKLTQSWSLFRRSIMHKWCKIIRAMTTTRWLIWGKSRRVILTRETPLKTSNSSALSCTTTHPIASQYLLSRWLTIKDLLLKRVFNQSHHKHQNLRPLLCKKTINKFSRKTNRPRFLLSSKIKWLLQPCWTTRTG